MEIRSRSRQQLSPLVGVGRPDRSLKLGTTATMVPKKFWRNKGMFTVFLEKIYGPPKNNCFIPSNSKSLFCPLKFDKSVRI